MINCYQYNLIENIRSCFVENWYQTWDFWICYFIAVIIIIVVFSWADLSDRQAGEP